jgi:lycopene cyclase domain-containing protein
MELALIAFGVTFGWEFWAEGWVRSRMFAGITTGLALMWFVLDWIAIHFQIWSFPVGGTLSYRLFTVPYEECLLFVIHTVACYLFVQMYVRTQP